jgi:predicted transcriptional regulator
VERQNPSGDTERDLFGRAIEPLRERRGRPSYKKSEENQRFVEVRAAAGWTHEMIAQDMGIDSDTLRKHFSAELELGRVKTEGMMLDVLLRKAREGHVPSVRELRERIERAAPKAPRRAKSGHADEGQTEQKPLGKKEAALEAARQVPGDYGDIFDRRRGRAN